MPWRHLTFKSSSLSVNVRSWKVISMFCSTVYVWRVSVGCVFGLCLFGLTDFLFLSPVRAPILYGRTSVPKPQNCTLNSGEKQCNMCSLVEFNYFCFVWIPLFRLTYWLLVAQMVPCCHWEVSTHLWFHRTTILAAVAFLDAFQKVADMATSSRGKMRWSHIFLFSRANILKATVKTWIQPKDAQNISLNVLYQLFSYQFLILQWSYYQAWAVRIMASNRSPALSIALLKYIHHPA